MERDRQIMALPGRSMVDTRNGQLAPSSGPGQLFYFEPLTDTPSSPGDENPLVEILNLLWSRWWVVVSVMLLAASAGAALTLIQSPVYRAKATLEIQVPQENLFGLQGSAGTPSYQLGSFLMTQVKTLESRSLRRRTLDALRKEHKLSTLRPPDRLGAWRRALGLRTVAAAGPAPARVPPFQTSVNAFENTQVVEVVCDSPDPNFSADYANALADEFIQFNLENRWTSYQRSSDWLSRQLSELKGKLEASEQELQKYSANAGLLFTGDKDSVQSGKLRQIQEELTKAQADRVAKQAVLEVANVSAADAVPMVIDNERLSSYQTDLTKLRRELAELSSLYTPDHYRVIRVKAQISEMEAAFRRERDAILQRIRNEFQSAQRREKLLLGDYASQALAVSEHDAKAIHYDVLKRDVDTNRQLYGALLQRVKEASVASAFSATNLRVMDTAEVPSSPYEPSLTSNILKGLSGGLLLGLFLVVASDRINRNLRAPGETPFHLKVPELGVIPASESAALITSNRPLKPKQSSILLVDSDGEAHPDERVELITWQDSNSLLAESFRSTIASILLSTNGGRPRVLLVTSASRGEGKSTTVSNLGISLAEIDQKILLIDADMRKPRLHCLFDLSNTWGLSDLLREKSDLQNSPLEALARPTQVANLWVLPSGPGTLSISNLLYSERMAELLKRFESEFQTVIIDTPPMLTISDARVLGRLADGAILVVRAGQTTRDSALSAKERLAEDGIPVLGTILNGWDLKSKARYAHQGYYYNQPS